MSEAQNLTRGRNMTPAPTPLLLLSRPLRKVLAILLFVFADPAFALEPCVNSELDRATAALADAKSGMVYALDQLESGTTEAFEKLGKWFGTPDTAAMENVVDTLTRSLAFVDGVTFYCLNQTDAAYGDIYAQVYSDSPFGVQLGSLFFSATVVGYDSQMGVIIHELSHFTLTGATGDDERRYGTAAALDRAARTPDIAVATADNYEYFVEDLVFSAQQ